MLKGAGEPEMAAAVVIFVSGILLGTAIIVSGLVAISAATKGNEDYVHIINKARAARMCFSDENGVLQPAKISYETKAACGIDELICIKGVLTGNSWLDCSRMDKDEKATVYAPLAANNAIHMGEIIVQKK